MKAIVAVDENWGIGKNGGLLLSIPEDMKFFRTVTKDAIVVMGRKTLDSFPGGRPLKNRVNVVLTRDVNFTREGTVALRDVEELKKFLDKQDKDKEVFVIGGGSIYRQLIDLCDTAYVTKIYKKFDSDTFFPNLDENPEWFISEEKVQEPYVSESGESIDYSFVTYEKS